MAMSYNTRNVSKLHPTRSASLYPMLYYPMTLSVLDPLFDVLCVSLELVASVSVLFVLVLLFVETLVVVLRHRVDDGEDKVGDHDQHHLLKYP